jgi:acyl dehydratase
MAELEIEGIEELQGAVGKTVGPSEWRQVTQQDIDDFARISRDDQWIHVDVERAERESPFGTTVAHGNLTLATIDGMRLDLMHSTGFKLGVNYGWNKVRFPAPVPAGSRIRLTIDLSSVDDVGGGWHQVITTCKVEVEGNEKPVCVAEHVGRVLAE